MLVLEDDSEIGKSVLSQNLARQYGFLRTAFEVWDEGHNLQIDHKFICDLNFYAVQFLSEHPGAYRECEVEINGSKHQPPPKREVMALMVDFLRQLSRRAGKGEPVETAAFVLWRLNWIHPFIQGNGRTARALSYYVLCKELKMWLPGTPIIPERIRKTRKRYEAGLEHADAIYKDYKRIDLTELKNYLDTLLTAQLADI